MVVDVHVVRAHPLDTNGTILSENLEVGKGDLLCGSIVWRPRVLRLLALGEQDVAPLAYRGAERVCRSC